MSTDADGSAKRLKTDHWITNASICVAVERTLLMGGGGVEISTEMD